MNLDFFEIDPGASDINHHLLSVSRAVITVGSR